MIPDNENLEGYTIGNMTEYRGYAMDLLPTTVGRQMGNAPNARQLEKTGLFCMCKVEAYG
jgi:hypothetical protein